MFINVYYQSLEPALCEKNKSFIPYIFLKALRTLTRHLQAHQYDIPWESWAHWGWQALMGYKKNSSWHLPSTYWVLTISLSFLSTALRVQSLLLSLPCIWGNKVLSGEEPGQGEHRFFLKVEGGRWKKVSSVPKLKRTTYSATLPSCGCESCALRSSSPNSW